jgi:hypothetical protein
VTLKGQINAAAHKANVPVVVAVLSALSHIARSDDSQPSRSSAKWSSYGRARCCGSKLAAEMGCTVDTRDPSWPAAQADVSRGTR